MNVPGIEQDALPDEAFVIGGVAAVRMFAVESYTAGAVFSGAAPCGRTDWTLSCAEASAMQQRPSRVGRRRFIFLSYGPKGSDNSCLWRRCGAFVCRSALQFAGDSVLSRLFLIFAAYNVKFMGEVRAKKALGQHFLVDLNIARKICDSLSGGSAAGGPCTVLEVGCGMGVLTQFLLRRSDIVIWGAEIDPESVAYLHAHYPEFAPRLVAGDFLGMNLRERFPEGLKIIGNFPYNISSQIFFKVLENRDLVPECVGMIQKEVAVRLAEPPGSKEYGILSVLLQAWYDIEYLFTVNETVFNPPPKVKSAVIRLRRNATERLGCDETLFVKVVKASFGQRRKMIRNSLKSVFGDFGGAEHPFFTRAPSSWASPSSWS